MDPMGKLAIRSPTKSPGFRWSEEEMLGDGYAAAERIALEPNGNPNYLPFGKVYLGSPWRLWEIPARIWAKFDL